MFSELDKFNLNESKVVIEREVKRLSSIISVGGLNKVLEDIKDKLFFIYRREFLIDKRHDYTITLSSDVAKIRYIQLNSNNYCKINVSSLTLERYKILRELVESGDIYIIIENEEYSKYYDLDTNTLKLLEKVRSKVKLLSTK